MKSVLYYVAPVSAVIMGLMLTFHVKTNGDFISWTNFLILVAIAEILFIGEK